MVDFYLYAYDEEFDPLNDSLPDTLACQLGDQLARARAVLAGRSREEIEYALGSLDWILRTGGDRHFEDVMEQFDTQASAVGYSNRAKVLKALVERFDLAGQSDFPNATWAEYFALLAVANVLEALHPANYPPAGGTRHDELTAYVLDWALEAMEAVCYAEQLQSETNLSARLAAEQKKNGKLMKARGQKGGKIRAAPFNELRDRVRPVWEKNHTGRSNRSAAKLIYKSMKEEIDPVLRGDDPEKRLEVWIADFKREQAKKTTA